MTPRILLAAALVLGAGAIPVVASAQAQTPAKGPFISSPEWIRKPTAGDFGRYYPRAAFAKRQYVQTMMTCGVTAEGRLIDCAVTYESVQGLGFAEAAIGLASTYVMKPLTRDGVSVAGGRVNVPVSWTLPTGLVGEPGVASAPSGTGPLLPETSVFWIKRPSAEEIALHAPSAAGPGAEVILGCRVMAQGDLSPCEVEFESNPGFGYWATAMKLSQSFDLPDGNYDRGRIRVRMRIAPGSPLPPSPPSPGKPQDVSVAWLKPPSAETLVALQPASTRGRLGVVSMLCMTGKAGRLGECLAERELGEGMEAAALSLLPQLTTATPAQKDGQPAGQLVRFKINWTAEGEVVLGDLPPVPIPDWAKRGEGAKPLASTEPLLQRTERAPKKPTRWRVRLGPKVTSHPSPEDFEQAYPVEALARLQPGQVLLKCWVKPDGSLTTCSVSEEAPEDMGFGAATLAISRRFQADLSKEPDRNDPAFRGLWIELIVEWNPPASAAWSGEGPTPGVRRPVWRRRPTGGDQLRLYPPAALAAGVQGRALMSCTVALDGTLADCEILKETPEKYGFGAATLSLANLYALEPKTAGGVTVAGGVVEMEIAWRLPE